MRDADALQIAERTNDADDHLFEFILPPKQALLLTFAEQILQVLSGLHKLADHGNSERVVHGFIEIVAIKLQDIWMCLYLEQLYCFFLKIVDFLTLYSFSLSRVLASTSLIA